MKGKDKSEKNILKHFLIADIFNLLLIGYGIYK